MSIFQTSRDTNRIFYLYPIVGELNTLAFDYQYNGFSDVEVKYSFSHDNSTWGDWFDTTTELIDSISTGIANINTYVRISIVTAKSRNLEFCSLEILSIVVNGMDYKIEHIEQGENNNIIVNAKSGNRFNPYRNTTQQHDLFAKMSKSISDIFSFECVYFKVLADEDSGSVTFKSYRLKNVVDHKPLDIVIKNNHIPGNAYVFSELDIDFQDEVEIHIVKEIFYEVFGEDFSPDTNDFLYLPLTDRMYEVNSTSAGANFMNTSPYWKAYLIKYESRDNIQRPDGIFDSLPSDIGTMEEFKPIQAQQEKDDASKPFDSINDDGSEDFITADSPNISGFRYAYVYPESEDFAKAYELEDTHKNVCVMFWLKFVGGKSIMVMTDADDNPTIKLTSTKRGFDINVGVFELSVSDLLIENNKWVGVVMNISKELNFASMSVYDDYGNLLVENSDSSMGIDESYIHSIVLNSGFVWTNFRVFSRAIPQSETYKLLSNPLPSYRDSIIIDNPTPNLL